MLAVVEEWGAELCNLVAVDDLQPKLLAVLPIMGFVVAADGLHDPFAHHGARAVGRLVEDQRVEAKPPTVFDAELGALFVNVDVAGVDQRGLVVSVQVVRESEERVLVEVVIRVQADDVLATREAEGFVGALLEADGRAMHDDSCAVSLALAEGLSELCRVVLRAVVDDNEFPVRTSLGKDAFDGLGKVPAIVVGDNVDSDDRSVHSLRWLHESGFTTSGLP